MNIEMAICTEGKSRRNGYAESIGWRQKNAQKTKELSAKLVWIMVSRVLKVR